MLKCFTKLITGVLAVSCLSVAVVNVRLMMNTSSSVKLSIPSIKIATNFAANNISIIKKFETKLADINFSENKKIINRNNIKFKNTEKVAATIKPADITLNPILINFNEPVKLEKVSAEYSLPVNLVSLIPVFNFEPETMIAAASEIKEDSISTSMASTDKLNVEPEFFEYEVTNEEEKRNEVITVEVQDIVEEKVVVASKTAPLVKEDYEKIADEFISFDYSGSVDNKIDSKQASQVKVEDNKSINKTVKILQKNSEVSSSATIQDNKIAKQEFPTSVNSLTTQKSNSKSVLMSIQASATNLKRNKEVKNFEVRFQDDLTEIYEDFGAGEVQLSTHVKGIMNRSMVLLKRGYAPTNTDLIVESYSKVTIPLIEEDVFSTLMDKYSKTSAQGALLIDLDEDTDNVLVDVEFSEEILLDQNLKRTNDENFRYKLLLGMNAGNAFITYKHFDGTQTSKIVHIHEREVTFDANLYEEVKHKQVALYEEGLLSKELSPLIIKGDQVRLFATEETANKLNQNTYKFNKKRNLLGERQYLEINHLSEPIFLGFRDNNKIVVPSEDFISFVLSKFEDKKLGNRCIIQVNLNAPVASFHIGAESEGSNLMTTSQVLDQDGKFYDSVGPKSNKIIILGENYGPREQSQDGKINIKVNYQDGSSRFVTSYCSPNTYLVEQL